VCAVSFQDLLQQLKSGLYTHTVLVVVIGPYTFESRIQKVAVELSNIIEGLAGVQLCTLFVLQICLTEYSSTVQWHYDEIYFSICILTLTITGLQRFR